MNYKQSLRDIKNSRIFRETFNDEASTRRNGGVPTNVVFDKGKGVFNGISSLLFFNNIKSLRTIRLRVNIPETVNNDILFDLRDGTVGINYCFLTTSVVDPNFSSTIYINGIEKNNYIIGDNDIIIVADSDLIVGQLSVSSNYVSTGNAKLNVDFIEIYDRALSQEEVSLLYNQRYHRALLESSNTYKTLLTVDSRKGVLDYTVGDNRENLIGYSEDIDNDYWNDSTIGEPQIIEANTTIAPDGNLTADLVKDFGMSTWNYRRKNLTSYFDINLFYTFSIWVKRASTNPSHYIRITTNNNSSWNGDSYKFIVTDEWQKISITWQPPFVTQAIMIGVFDEYGLQDTDCFGSIYMWGAHLQYTELTTPYIKTTDTPIKAIRPVATDITFPKVGEFRAASANGSTTKIDCGTDFIGTKAFTVMGWINPRDLGEGLQYDRGRVIDNYSLTLRIHDNNRFRFFSSGIGTNSCYSEVNSLPPNKLVFFSMTRNSDSLVNFFIGDINTSPSLSYNPDQYSGELIDGGSNLIILNRSLSDRTFNGTNPLLTIKEGILSLEDITNYWANTKNLI